MIFVYIFTAFLFIFIFVSSLKNKILREIGFRNILRRKSTTALVIFGSLIGTALIAGSLTLGDSFNKSSRNQAEKTLGEIDAQIKLNKSGIESTTAVNRGFKNENPLDNIITLNDVENIKNTFDANRVDGVLPAIDISTSIIKGTDPKNSLGLSSVDILGYDNQKFGAEDINLNIPDGKTIVSKDVADGLELNVGDTITAFNGVKPLKLEVIGINDQKGVLSFSNKNGNIILSPQFIRKEFNLSNETYNVIFVSAKGSSFEPTYDGNVFKNYLSDKLNDVKISSGTWDVKELKSARLSNGDQIITYAFLGVSLVGVLAGILLIINIYSMLAEERKMEMGTLRALAFTKGNLIRTFMYEGFVYSLIASLIGVAIGVGLGYFLLNAITSLAKDTLQNANFQIVFDTKPQSWITSFCLGLLITFGTAFIASRRISNINIVSAIRNIPDEKDFKRNKWFIIKLIIQLLLLQNFIGSFIFGIIILNTDQKSDLRSIVSKEAIGGYLIFLGVVLTCYMLSVLIGKLLTYSGKDKYRKYVVIAFNLPPLILALFLGKISLFEKVFESLLGYSLLLVAGITIIITTTTIITYNIDAIKWVVEKTIGRNSILNGITKIALKFSGENKFRTGITILMFALVLFLVSFLSVLKLTIDDQIDKFTPKTGYQAFTFSPKYIDAQKVKSDVEKLGITQDIAINKSILVNYDNIKVGDIYPDIGYSEQQKNQTETTRIFGYDENFINNNPLKLISRMDKFKSDDELIKTTLNDPRYVILTPYALGTKTYVNPPEKLKLGNTVTINTNGKKTDLIVAGFLDPTAPQNYTTFQYSMLTGNKVFDLMDKNFSEQFYENNIAFRINNPSQSMATNLKDIQKVLIPYNLGNNLFSIGTVFEQISAYFKGSITILQGFLSFSLFVGIAGIAILMVRSVHERRQQIGMLRSLGFQRKHILYSFFIEASFIIFLGIAIGLVSGALTGDIFFTARNNAIDTNNISESAKTSAIIPYNELLTIGIGVYIVSILFTLLPSFQASKMEPVEATNYLD